MSLKEKISTFNKPEENEEDVREKQRKKALYNSKLAKFQSNEIKSKKPSDTKLKAKIFEDMEGHKEREKEAEIRKEDFKKKKEVFTEDTIEKEDINPNNNEVSKKKIVFEPEEPIEEDMTDSLERERRKEEFLEKQIVFGK